MKRIRTFKSLYDLPELEESEFTPSYSRASRFEDSNDLGDIGDSFSIGLDMMDMDDSFASLDGAINA